MKKATLNKKVEHVNETQTKFAESKSAVVVDYLGLTVAEVSELRTNLHNAGCELRVIKNNIIEFNKYKNKCKYSDCMHINEDECEIKRLVDKDIILKSRYENYTKFISEIKSIY